MYLAPRLVLAEDEDRGDRLGGLVSDVAHLDLRRERALARLDHGRDRDADAPGGRGADEAERERGRTDENELPLVSHSGA